MTMALTDEKQAHVFTKWQWHGTRVCDRCAGDADDGLPCKALAEQASAQCDGNGNVTAPDGWPTRTEPPRCPGCPKCRPEPAQAEVDDVMLAKAEAIAAYVEERIQDATPLREAISKARRCAQAETAVHALSRHIVETENERDALRERVAELERENSRLMERLTVCIKANNRARGK
jgi:hypothetical protein